MSYTRTTCRGGAFTLIELLVVIAIIGILVSLTLPALAGARNTARATHCAINARSIAQGLSLYADDHHEVFPHWSAWQVYGGDGTGDDTDGPGWAELAADYLENLAVFVDPARRIPEAPFAYFLQSKYTFERTGSMYTSLSAPQVAFAGSFVLLGDCNSPTFFPRPYGDSVKQPDCDQDDARWECVFLPPGAGDLRPHKRRVNLVFLDAHAGSFAQYERGKMTWHGNKMVDWSMNP